MKHFFMTKDLSFPLGSIFFTKGSLTINKYNRYKTFTWIFIALRIEYKRFTFHSQYPTNRNLKVRRQYNSTFQILNIKKNHCHSGIFYERNDPLQVQEKINTSKTSKAVGIQILDHTYKRFFKMFYQEKLIIIILRTIKST